MPVFSSPDHPGGYLLADPQFNTEVTGILRQGRMLGRHHFQKFIYNYWQQLKTDGSVPEGQREKLLNFIEIVAISLRVGEHFVFRNVSVESMVDDMPSAVRMMQTGLVGFPYAITIFSFNYDDFSYVNQVAGEVPLSRGNGVAVIVRVNRDGTVDGWGKNAVVFDSTVPHQRDMFGEDRDVYFVFGMLAALDANDSVQFGINGGYATSFRAGAEIDSVDAVVYTPAYLRSLMSEDKEIAVCRSTLGTVAVLNMILNTKNMPMEKVVISPKLNKARKKNGKPELRDYTILNYTTYRQAREETQRRESEPGHRKSPRTHLRRGHIRHYESHDVWIHDMIINADAEEKMIRREYVVKSGAAQPLRRDSKSP